VSLYLSMLDYSYPKVFFDFKTNREVEALDTVRLEKYFRDALTSGQIDNVKDGLSNVVYWGNAQQGVLDARVQNFRSNVSAVHLNAFIELAAGGDWGVTEIEAIRMPVFSRMSFITKILAFLEPERFVVLDLQLAQLATVPGPHVLTDLVADSTSIRITQNNLAVYERWCVKCASMAAGFPTNWGIRAVDIERGLFGLVQNGHAVAAAALLR
jgi:hypothetical protein